MKSELNIPAWKVWYKFVVFGSVSMAHKAFKIGCALSSCGMLAVSARACSTSLILCVRGARLAPSILPICPLKPKVTYLWYFLDNYNLHKVIYNLIKEFGKVWDSKATKLKPERPGSRTKQFEQLHDALSTQDVCYVLHYYMLGLMCDSLFCCFYV